LQFDRIGFVVHGLSLARALRPRLPTSLVLFAGMPS
jgi:hypothetical protein